MARRLTLLTIFLAAAIAVYAGRHYFARHHSAAKNQRAAPELSLTDINGSLVRTGGYHGKVVLVNFWAAWCVPCADEIPQFVALQKKYQDQGLQVIGVSVEDDAADLLAFCRQHQVNYPVVPGDIRTADAFGGVLGLPTTFVIGRDNLIRHKYDGTTNFAALEKDVVGLLHESQGTRRLTHSANPLE